ncbi:hypothetical protein ACIBCM_18005 [Streptomyces sp. NPDC051018]|uniref:hypothetical protein n=1 Tax=Streptomyces sp. NPDC051018 TaxID=3365639 RepID=UPI0037974F28
MTDDNPAIRLRLYAERAARLRAAAEAYRLARLARTARPPRPLLRIRVGWTLIEIGLRLVQRTPSPLRSSPA